MQCLWLTLADSEPATNGQLIYSKGLIKTACNAGASLMVIGAWSGRRICGHRPTRAASRLQTRIASMFARSAPPTCAIAAAAVRRVVHVAHQLQG
jgi:hypothetical protein